MRGTARLDLRLNLSPPRARVAVEGSGNESSGETSPLSSCISSELNQEVSVSVSPSSSSSSAAARQESTAMVLAGCPRCLIYVMVLKNDCRCPKCRSNVLLDLLSNDSNNNKHDKKKKSN